MPLPWTDFLSCSQVLLCPSPLQYDPSTTDINNDPEEMSYWIEVLMQGIPTVVEKAAASEGNTSGGWWGGDRGHLLRNLHVRPWSGLQMGWQVPATKTTAVPEQPFPSTPLTQTRCEGLRPLDGCWTCTSGG